MEKISRLKAKELGLRFYYTGKPCNKAGHVAPRYVSGWACKVCNAEHSKEWHGLNPESRAKTNAKAQAKKYNTSPEYIQELKTKQKNLCATCNVYLHDPHVDHNHATGKVRGLLCKHCNWALGHAKDNPATLRSMAKYIEDHDF